MLASIAGYTAPMMINFISTPLLLRALGETAYGLQSLVAVVIGYFTIMDMGLAWPIIKYLAEDHAQGNIKGENCILSTTLQLYSAIGLIGMVAIMLSANLLARSVFKVPEVSISPAIYVFRLAGLGFLASVWLSWGQAVGIGLQRFEGVHGISIVNSLAGVSLGLAAVYAGYGVVGYVLMRVVVSLLAGLLYWVLVRRLLPLFRLHFGFDRATFRRIRGYVGYGAINRVASSLLSRLDQTLIGIWLGVAAAGIYSVPFLVVNSLGLMIAYMLGFIFPMTSELQSLGEMDRLRDIFTRATQFITALSGMIFVPLFVLGDIVLGLWVPSIADQAARVFRLLTLASYLGTLCASLINSVVIGMGRIRQFTIYITIRNLMLAAWCFLLIRPFGLEGAGWALLLTAIVDGIYLIVALRNYLQLSPLVLFRTAYIKPMALSAVLGMLAFLARPLAMSWIGLVGIGAGLGFLYIVAGYWIGVFGETEKRALAMLWQLAVRRAP
jgi:O-antigen/teichoic acid export membrane protein